MDDLEGRIGDAAESIWARLKSVFAVLFFVGWSGAWAFMLLMGYLFAAPTLMAVSGGAVALGILVAIVRRMVRQRRLEAQAEHELVAKAKLEGVKIDRNMLGVLSVFDVSYAQIRATLAEPGLAQETIAVDAELDLERVRDRLFSTAVAKSNLLRELRKLGRNANNAVAKKSIEDARRAVEERQRDAEAVTRDAQRLLTRLEDVRRLSGGIGAASSRTELESVLNELDATANAYAEIEEAETAEERRIRALRASRSQATRS